VQRFILDEMGEGKAYATSTLARIYAHRTGVKMTSHLRYSMRRGARRLIDQGLIGAAYVLLPTHLEDQSNQRWSLIVFVCEYSGTVVASAYLSLLMYGSRD
jgi:hypothetical protein